MKNKKIIILVAIIIIIITAGIVFLTIKKQDNNDIIIKDAETTAEQRKIWNNFLNSNPYLSQISSFSEAKYISDSDLLKLAINSENISIEYIVTEEIDENSLLSLGDGYKKSKNNINKYLKEILNIDELAYNFVETYVEEDNYVLINEEYVYFTKIELPEKIYLAVEYNEQNGKYEVQIYEYDVTEENRETLRKMLETGKINNTVNTSNRYILTGQIENENIKIKAKTSL